MAFRNEYVLNVDLKRQFKNTIPTFVQYDTARLIFKIYDDNTPFDFPSVTEIKIYHKRPDNVIVEGICTQEVIDNQLCIVYDYLGNEMYKTGFVETTVAIYQENKKVQIQPFKVMIIDNIMDGAATPSNPEYGMLQGLINQVKDLISQTEQDIIVLSEKLENLYEQTTKNIDNLIKASTVKLDGIIDEAEKDIDELINDSKQLIDDALQNIDDWKFVYHHDITKSYVKNNIVSFNGSTYIAIQDNVGIYPTDDINDTNWRLLARKGTDGDGVLVVRKDVFNGVKGQTEFILNNSYDQLQNRIHLVVGGSLQYAPQNFMETSANKVTLHNPLPADMEVVAVYFSEAPVITNDLQVQINGLNDILQKFNLNNTIKVTEDATLKIEEMNKYILKTLLAIVVSKITSSLSVVTSAYALTQGDYAKEQGQFANLNGSYANEQAEIAKEKSVYAELQGDYAKAQGDYAKEKALQAENAVANVDRELLNVSEVISGAMVATSNAVDASNNANDKAIFAEEQGNYAKLNGDEALLNSEYAKTQGDYAKEQGDLAKSIVNNDLVVSVNGLTGAITGIETVEGSQEKATQALEDSKAYTNKKLEELNNEVSFAKVDKFTSIDNQSLFNLTSTYSVGENKLRVIVGGVEQFVVDGNFSETSVNSFTLSEGIPLGIKVIAIYNQ